MNDILSEQQEKIFTIIFNRVDKHNAFDDKFLQILQKLLDYAISTPTIRLIIIKANGKNFSAGADITWMQRTINYNIDENINDALILAKALYTIYTSNKPIIAITHGVAYGGGAGLLAACDIVIADNLAKFCFSEVKIGLVPAIISPYVIKAIGSRHAQCLFISAEVFNAQRAKELGLIHYCLDPQELNEFIINYTNNLLLCAPQAITDCKQLVHDINNQPINIDLITKTAKIIANKRISIEGQQGLNSFLNKKSPNWN